MALSPSPVCNASDVSLLDMALLWDQLLFICPIFSIFYPFYFCIFVATTRSSWSLHIPIPA